MKNFMVCFVVFTFFATTAFAGMVKVQGVGQMTYGGWGGPSASVKQEALTKAKLNALTRHASGFSTAKLKNFEAIRSDLEKSIDRYVPVAKMLDEETNKGAKTYSVVVQASVDTGLVDLEIQKVSAIEQSGENDKSYLSFVFVSREAKQVKKFDARVSKRRVEEKSEEQSEEASVEGNAAQLIADSKTDSVLTTGGSTVQKSDQIEYDVSNSADINVTMGDVFSTSGFEVVEAVYLEEETNGLVNVENFIEDYRYGDDISGDTRRDAVKGCRSVDIGYFAIGTLDVGMKDTDPVSGLTRVNVSVSGKVLSLKRRFPKTVASIGPVQYAGLGPDQVVAKRNALKKAGESAAKDLVAQLQAKDIR